MKSVARTCGYLDTRALVTENAPQHGVLASVWITKASGRKEVGL
jgi:hypothetical protein